MENPVLSNNYDINCPVSVNNSGISLANNQTEPNNYEVLALSTVLKSNPQFVVCPHCKSKLKYLSPLTLKNYSKFSEYKNS